MTVTFGDDLRAAVKMVYRAQYSIVNVLQYHAGAGVSESEGAVTAAIAAQMALLYAEVAGMMTDHMAGEEVVVAKRNPVDGTYDTIGIADFTAFAGTSTVDPLPATVTAVLRRLAVGTGRQSKVSVGVLHQTVDSDDLMTASAILDMVDFGDILLQDINMTSGDLNPGWWSDAIADWTDNDAGYIINALLGTMVRRKLGVGA